MMKGKCSNDKICTHENVVVLLFIIPAENLEHQEMTTENNKLNRDGNTSAIVE